MGNLEVAEGRSWDDGEEPIHEYQQLVWSIKDTTVAIEMEKILSIYEGLFIEVLLWTRCFSGGIIQDGNIKYLYEAHS